MRAETVAERQSGSTLMAASSIPEALFGYEVIDFLGEGAGSLIYAVSDPISHQIYALKHVVRRDERDVRFVEQLEAEFEVGRLVRHAGLRRCIDLKIERTLLRKVTEAALVMELVDGRSLENDRPDNLADLVEIFIKVAEALGALHDAGFVHCDLKPNNILVDQRRDVKVIDLGQACRIGTVKARIQGTPDYIAPEQVKCEAVTVRTDVFNFGATMYWALTGGQKLPTLYTVQKSGAKNSFLLDDGISPPRAINTHVPENLSRFVMECVRTNPLERPQSFLQVARRLDVLHHTLTRSPMDAVRARELLEQEEAAEEREEQLVKTAMPFGDDCDWFAE